MVTIRNDRLWWRVAFLGLFLMPNKNISHASLDAPDQSASLSAATWLGADDHYHRAGNATPGDRSWWRAATAKAEAKKRRSEISLRLKPYTAQVGSPRQLTCQLSNLGKYRELEGGMKVRFAYHPEPCLLLPLAPPAAAAAR